MMKQNDIQEVANEIRSNWKPLARMSQQWRVMESGREFL